MTRCVLLMAAILIAVSAKADNITFADANVKALCVGNWDTDKDGELSTEEAAAVTTLGTVFKGKTNITTFDELRYFTGDHRRRCLPRQQHRPDTDYSRHGENYRELCL